jgi:hypothetical protein
MDIIKFKDLNSKKSIQFKNFIQMETNFHKINSIFLIN